MGSERNCKNQSKDIEKKFKELSQYKTQLSKIKIETEKGKGKLGFSQLW